MSRIPGWLQMEVLVSLASAFYVRNSSGLLAVDSQHDVKKESDPDLESNEKRCIGASTQEDHSKEGLSVFIMFNQRSRHENLEYTLILAFQLPKYRFLCSVTRISLYEKFCDMAGVENISIVQNENESETENPEASLVNVKDTSSTLSYKHYALSVLAWLLAYSHIGSFFTRNGLKVWGIGLR